MPVATAQAFRKFVAAWAVMDPNRTWEPHGVTIDLRDGRLDYRDGDGNEDSWDLYGVTDAGEELYALDGWAWIEI